MSVSFGHSINQCPIATAEKAANENDNQLAMDRALMKEVELTKDPSSSHTVRASHNSSYSENSIGKKGASGFQSFS